MAMPMHRPMMTGYGNDQMEEMTEPVDNAMEESQEFVPSDLSPDAPGAPMPKAGGRTGADVIAAALAQPTLRTGNPKAQQVGTTGFQGEMDYGADPGYGV